MRQVIKNYELNTNINVVLLENAKFIKENNKMVYIHPLNEEIELHISIPENDMNNCDIKVIDTDLDDLYYAFYDDSWNFPALQKTIKEYNKTMDFLVKKGIFSEKTK